MTNEELTNLVSALNPFFVSRSDCQKSTRDLEQKVDAYGISLAVIEQRLKTITWILTAIGGAVITGAVTLLINAVK